MARWWQVLLDVARKESNCAPLVVYLKCGPILSGSFCDDHRCFHSRCCALDAPYVPNLLNVTGQKSFAE